MCAFKLLALSGYAGSGKDEAAKALVARGWLRVSFADAVRDCTLALDPIIDYTWVGAPVHLSSIISRGWPEAKERKEVRRLLQRMGTEVGRDVLGLNTWVEIAERKIEETTRPVVITDLRFPNEAQMVARRGGRVARISRPGVVAVNSHASESQPIKHDYLVMNDGTIADLHAKILALAEPSFLREEKASAE